MNFGHDQSRTVRREQASSSAFSCLFPSSYQRIVSQMANDYVDEASVSRMIFDPSSHAGRAFPTEEDLKAAVDTVLRAMSLHDVLHGKLHLVISRIADRYFIPSSELLPAKSFISRTAHQCMLDVVKEARELVNHTRSMLARNCYRRIHDSKHLAHVVGTVLVWWVFVALAVRNSQNQKEAKLP